MNVRRVTAVARKEFLHVLRDIRSVGMAVAIPMLMLILFGYALTLDVDNVPLVVWDQSQSPESREFVSKFAGSRYFTVKEYVYSYGEIERAIDKGQARLGLVVSRRFATDIASGRDAPVQAILDGSDANTAWIIKGYADAIVRGYSQELQLQALWRQGMVSVQAPLDLRPRIWFNADLRSRNYIIPGLIAVIMMVIAALLTSLTVAREWERGTMEQLISTPVKGYELVLGKLIPYFVIGMVDVLLAVVMGQFLFEVPLRGSVGLVFGMAAIFLAGVLSLGILISIVTKSQLLASQIAMITTLLPAFLLSGYMIPINNMPALVQKITYIVPARYFVALLKDIYLKGVGLEILGNQALLLTVFGVAMVAAAIIRFKKRLE
jgi:ABC-2 type transport system permease protein